jgi:hypothetical protein
MRFKNWHIGKIMGIRAPQLVRSFCACIIIVLFARAAFAQSDADVVNKSGNPLNPVTAFNIRNYYTPGVLGDANPFLGRRCSSWRNSKTT